ncbi:Nucleoside triphosphate pyrophosphohydrolase [Corynebacterium ciconiae DSM 44920]|uniref:MazG nucleotide pyrophosphohydrolase domain-containing protein n=1 Tax=Corynebacterium ciconiae TaxID=227319 RepID=UPI0003675F34|nr:MazG nucleotide pyrophosphohydrolase domain-containing protein [Corynebacterium ciconiae]WKD61564.1 Nucleoside triphosphate pyrophosphohydrolase [Corynebacterium ciconiae DSM 44920]
MRTIVLDADNNYALPLDAIPSLRGPVLIDATLPTSVQSQLRALGAVHSPDASVCITAGPQAGAVAVMERALEIGQWERRQTHSSLVPYLREETEEFIAAVAAWERGDASAEELRKELADVYLQVLFHAEIARRRGDFSMAEVAQAFVSKLQARAPYLFDGTSEIVDEAEQDRLWQEAKRAEHSAS